MRVMLSIALIAAALAGCAGVPDEAERADSEISPGVPAEMEDLEPEGSFDEVLENKPGE